MCGRQCRGSGNCGPAPTPTGRTWPRCATCWPADSADTDAQCRIGWAQREVRRLRARRRPARRRIDRSARTALAPPGAGRDRRATPFSVSSPPPLALGCCCSTPITPPQTLPSTAVLRLLHEDLPWAVTRSVASATPAGRPTQPDLDPVVDQAGRPDPGLLTPELREAISQPAQAPTRASRGDLTRRRLREEHGAALRVQRESAPSGTRELGVHNKLCRSRWVAHARARRLKSRILDSEIVEPLRRSRARNSRLSPPVQQRAVAPDAIHQFHCMYMLLTAT